MFRRLDKFDGPIFGGGGGGGERVGGIYTKGGLIYGGHMTLTTLKFTNNARVMELPYRMSKQFLVLHLIWNSI